jgi:hypothetical protein
MTEYSATSRTTGPAPGRVVPVPAVVLQGPANSAPELIVGPFATMEDAQEPNRGTVGTASPRS